MDTSKIQSLCFFQASHPIKAKAARQYGVCAKVRFQWFIMLPAYSACPLALIFSPRAHLYSCTRVLHPFCCPSLSLHIICCWWWIWRSYWKRWPWLWLFSSLSSSQWTLHCIMFVANYFIIPWQCNYKSVLKSPPCCGVHLVLTCKISQWGQDIKAIYSYSSTHRASCCIKWARLSNCLFWEVSKIFKHLTEIPLSAMGVFRCSSTSRHTLFEA